MNEKKQDAPPTTQIQLQTKERRTALTAVVKEFRLSDGKVVGIKSGVAKVRLWWKSGHIAIWGRDDDQTITITADGYAECNRIAAISVRPAPIVTVPGIDPETKRPWGNQPNPHHIYDDRGAYSGSVIRMVGIGATPLGGVAIVDRTLHFNTRAYFLEGLAGIAKKNPLAVITGVQEINPAETLADLIRERNDENKRKADEEPEKFGWLLKQVTSDSDLDRAVKRAQRNLWQFIHTGPDRFGYWVDFGSAAILSLHNDFVRSQKFDARKAEAIAIRNVLRRHPLMPSLKRAPAELIVDGKDKYVEVPVFFSQTLDTKEMIEEAFAKFDDEIRTGAPTGGEDVSTGRDAEEAGRDDDAPPREEENPDAEPTQETPPVDPADEVRSEILQLETIAGPEIVKGLLATTKYADLADPKVRAKAEVLGLLPYRMALTTAIKKRDAKK